MGFYEMSLLRMQYNFEAHTKDGLEVGSHFDFESSEMVAFAYIQNKRKTRDKPANNNNRRKS